MMSLNGWLEGSIIGKTVKFDVQPYERGTGIIRKASARRIKTNDYCPRRGYMLIEYDTFDLEIEVIEGSSTGALWGGVPVASTIKNKAGKMTHISGVSKGQIYNAIEEGETIVIARCG
jgi:hypothetical protein